MAHVIDFASAAAPPRRDGFVMTETASDMLRSLRLLRELDGGALTMIAGAPGVGKSRAVEAFMKEAPDATVIRMAKGEGTAWNLAKTIAGLYHASLPMNAIGLSGVRERLGAWLGPDAILIVDEAQYLDHRDRKTGERGAALEWMRALAETAGCALALVGDLALEEAVARYPQLRSRMRRPVVVRSSPPEDVAALAAAVGIEDDAILRALRSVAKRDGALRNVENVLRVAALFAEGGAVRREHVHAAIVDMKLAPAGGNAR